MFFFACNVRSVVLFTRLIVASSWFSFHIQRGIYRMNDTDVFIQPLPERFGIGSHILIEKNINDSMFEPQEKFLSPDIVKELHKRRVKRAPLLKFSSGPKFYQSSTSKLPVPQTLHIETAIFVDKVNFLIIFN